MFNLENYAKLSLGMVQVHSELGSTGNEFIDTAVLSSQQLQFQDVTNGNTYQVIKTPTIKDSVYNVSNIVDRIEVVSALPQSRDPRTLYFVLN